MLEQWGAALRDPGMRAGIMQMGLQLMQPMGFGQSSLGHLAQAVGAGGEASTRVEDQALKDQLAQSRMDAQNATLGLGQARVDIGNRNATTREKALQARTAGGGLSAKDLFRAGQSESRALENKAKWEAGQIVKQVTDAELLGTQLDPGIARYKGKGAGDIYRELLADPQWRQKSQIAGQTAAGATVPPPEQRQVGQVYNTPKGPMVWRGNGWAPATAAPDIPVDTGDEVP